MDFNQLFSSFVSHPGAFCAVAELFAIVWLARELIKAKNEVTESYKIVLPVMTKVADVLPPIQRLVERMMDRP